MEENVALDSSRQHQFIKSIKGIKKFMKKKSSNVEKVITEVKTSDVKRKKKTYQGKGLVYLSHIPHGFYEHQMTQYFKQFGRVTNARVIRSKRTGNSKGCAFVEFSEPSVGQIVAETMNNYLMGKRLLKAVYIPPEKQRRNVFRKNWTSLSNPGADHRKKMNKSFNKVKTEQEEGRKSRRLHSKLLALKQKLSAIGIDYGFFDAVDYPQFIIDTLDYKKEDKPTEEFKEALGIVSKNDTVKNMKENKTENKETVEKSTKNKKEKKAVKIETEPVQKTKKKTVGLEQPETVQVFAEPKKKGKNGKEAPKIVPIENFITLKQNVQDGSEDDASDFDSDAFIKNLENESSDGSDDDEPAVKEKSKNKLSKQTPHDVKKFKQNGNTKVNGFANGGAVAKKSKKNKKPFLLTGNKRKAENEGQKELSRFSTKKKKTGIMKTGKATT